VREQEFTPGIPGAAAAAQWNSASSAAVIFWRAVGEDARVSAEFRAIAVERLMPYVCHARLLSPGG
jgi:hypothetical protein